LSLLEWFAPGAPAGCQTGNWGTRREPFKE